MSELPPAAVEAAAEALCIIHSRPGEPPNTVPDEKDPRNRIAACYRCQRQAPAALLAALPAITEHLREQWAQEIEASIKTHGAIWDDERIFSNDGKREAARIVREGPA